MCAPARDSVLAHSGTQLVDGKRCRHQSTNLATALVTPAIKALCDSIPNLKNGTISSQTRDERSSQVDTMQMKGHHPSWRRPWAASPSEALRPTTMSHVRESQTSTLPSVRHAELNSQLCGNTKPRLSSFACKVAIDNCVRPRQARLADALAKGQNKSFKHRRR